MSLRCVNDQWLVSAAWNAPRALKLAAMMEAAIQRRFPKGLKVHVHSVDRFGCLSSLTRVLRDANLSVTRAKVQSPAFAVRHYTTSLCKKHYT